MMSVAPDTARTACPRWGRAGGAKRVFLSGGTRLEREVAPPTWLALEGGRLEREKTVLFRGRVNGVDDKVDKLVLPPAHPARPIDSVAHASVQRMPSGLNPLEAGARKYRIYGNGPREKRLEECSLIGPNPLPALDLPRKHLDLVSQDVPQPLPLGDVAPLQCLQAH